MDTFTAAERSAIMRAVHSENTTPELIIRRLVRALGLRYRLHAKDLAGRPDLVFPRLKKAIFVNGCFWHGHNCSAAHLPKTNVEYWIQKQSRNARRDKRNVRSLRAAGWSVLVVWECTVKRPSTAQRLAKFLRG